jgi:hypothetical protein
MDPELTFEEEIRRNMAFADFQCEARRLALKSIMALNALEACEPEENKTIPIEVLNQYERIAATAGMLKQLVAAQKK